MSPFALADEDQLRDVTGFIEVIFIYFKDWVVI